MAAERKPETEQPLDVGDQHQVETRKKSAKQREKELDETLRLIMSQKNGRAWMWDLLEHCGAFRLSFHVGDPHITSFNEGRRDAGQKVLGQIVRVCPEHYATMTKENTDG